MVSRKVAVFCKIAVTIILRTFILRYFILKGRSIQKNDFGNFGGICLLS